MPLFQLDLRFLVEIKQHKLLMIENNCLEFIDLLDFIKNIANIQISVDEFSGSLNVLVGFWVEEAR